MTTTTPSLVQLDATEDDVITAARALAALPVPLIRVDTPEHMAEDDALAAAMYRLRDALQRFEGDEPWRLFLSAGLGGAAEVVRAVREQVEAQAAGRLRGQSIWLSRPKDDDESQTAFAMRLVASQHYSDAADLIRGDS